MTKRSACTWIGRAPAVGLASLLALSVAAPVRAGDGIARTEESHPSVAYSGAWTPRDATGGNHFWSGGTAQSTYTAGARATLRFTGTGVTWIGFRNNRTGIARVFVDGRLVAVVDTAGPSPTPTGVWQVPMYTIQGLSDGPHTITIEATGDYNRIVSGGAWVVVDAFDVTS